MPLLVGDDDEWRLRLLLHDFGMVWADAGGDDRRGLVNDEPAHIDAHWDAFVAALAEHLCWHARIAAPDWVHGHGRYLSSFWFPAIDSPTLKVEAVVHAPAAFEAHGVLLPARELLVV